MRLTGWRVEGNLPDLRKYLIIVAPHTSNWDFFYGFLAYMTLRLDATWLAKHTIFRWPLGPIDAACRMNTNPSRLAGNRRVIWNEPRATW